MVDHHIMHSKRWQMLNAWQLGVAAVRKVVIGIATIKLYAQSRRAWSLDGLAALLCATMGINFILLVNKQGQTRLAKYTNASMTVDERRALEGEIVRRCLARSEKQVP